MKDLTNCAICARLYKTPDLEWFEFVPAQPILICSTCKNLHLALKPAAAEGPEDDPEFWDVRGDR